MATVQGQVIGSYRLVSELGRGGMGVVYVGEHVTLGRPAAVKMLLPQFSTDEAIVKRFFNEARAASQIDHPGIVEIYEFGTHTDGRAYIVMALLKGETLQQRIARAPLAPDEAAAIVAQVASALAVAHARGIVHRDLKPDNIFLVPNELVAGGVQVKLLDFGIAKLADERASFKTQTGSLIGTPAYMSPEQCMGRSDLDHRTDLYALGCILFHALCGRPPFVSDAGAGPMIAAHLRDPAPDPRAFNPYINDALAAIVLQLLEKDPAHRIQSAGELRDVLIAGANVSLSRPITAQASSVTPPTLSPTRPSAPRTPYQGPEAYHATTAPTTGSGSAAQLIRPRVEAPSRKGMWIGLAAATVAAGAIAAVVVVSRDDSPARPRGAHAPPPPVAEASAPPRTASTTSAGTPVTAPPPAPGSATSIASVEPPPSVPPAPPTQPEPERKPIAPCPEGQSRRDDTHGQCCWPEQAWSTTKQRCVGTPRCPAGMTLARGDSCVASTAPVDRDAVPGAVPKFTLDAASYAPGKRVTFRFAAPVSSTGDRRAWVTIVEAGRPKEAYGEWTFVNDKATTVQLSAPTRPGRYEARVHTDYNRKTTNLRHSVELAVEAPSEEPPSEAPLPEATPRSGQRFKLLRDTLAIRENATIVFPQPMRALPGERFWITVVKAGTPDDQWADYEYVPDKAMTMTMRMPATAGAYELRLHANYPTKSRNLVHRVRVTVR